MMTPDLPAFAPLFAHQLQQLRTATQAALHCHGPTRTEVYEPLPKWRRAAKRPSCLDLVTLLRKQLADKPVTFPTATTTPTYQTMLSAAAA